MPPERMIDAWRRIYDTCGSSHIYITGGEPFYFPGFTDVVRVLTTWHRIHITSNVSLPLDEFVSRTDPQKISLNASFHPQHMDLAAFTKQVLRLRNAGFKCAVCYLAHPLQLREMMSYRKYFSGFGIDMDVTRFSGVYDGKQFPHEYSPAQLELIGLVEKRDPVEKKHRYAEAFQIPSHGSDGSGPDHPLLPDELPCNAGVTYANVNAAGDVKRCGREHASRLGNIFEGTFSFLDEPRPCSSADANCPERIYCEVS